MTDELKPLETLKGRGAGARPDPPPGDDVDHVFIRNAVAIVGKALFGEEWLGTQPLLGETTDRVREALRTGELRAATHSKTFSSFFDVDPNRWFGDAEEIRKRFATGKMGMLESTSFSPDWWFVTRKSLDKYLFRLSRPPTTSTTFAFDMSERRWRLFDACIWVATDGNPTTTAAIADGNLDEVGARVLFDKLDELGMRGPKVTGLSITDNRSPLGTSYWERAHTGWLGHAAGHRIDFYFSDETPDQVAADLTPNRHINPMYRDLRIDRDAFLALYPAKPSATPATVKGKGGPRTPEELKAEKDCADWLVTNYMSVPELKPIAKATLRELAFVQPGWGPALRGKNAFERAWAMAVASGPFPLWSEGGDPRRDD